MKNKIQIPKGWYVVRNGSRIRNGDRFKKMNGHWSKTSDAGRKIEHGGSPFYDNQLEYAGIYIRRKSP